MGRGRPSAAGHRGKRTPCPEPGQGQLEALWEGERGAAMGSRAMGEPQRGDRRVPQAWKAGPDSKARRQGRSLVGPPHQLTSLTPWLIIFQKVDIPM